MIVSVLNKIFLLPFFLRYLTPAVKKKHIALTAPKFRENNGTVLYNFTRKKKYRVTNVPVKSKIVTFLLVNI